MGSDNDREIIKTGTLYQDRTFEITCRMCKSVLRFKGSEVDIGIDVNSIVCPVCGTWLHVGPANNIGGLKDVTP